MDSKANSNSIREYDLQILKLKQQRKKEIVKEVKAIIKTMRTFNITLADLIASGAKSISSGEGEGNTKSSGRKGKAGKKTKSEPKGADKRSQVKPKYRDPAKGQTWTGRGRTPSWMLEYEKSGRSRSEFLI